MQSIPPKKESQPQFRKMSRPRKQKWARRKSALGPLWQSLPLQECGVLFHCWFHCSSIKENNDNIYTINPPGLLDHKKSRWVFYCYYMISINNILSIWRIYNFIYIFIWKIFWITKNIYWIETSQILIQMQRLCCNINVACHINATLTAIRQSWQPFFLLFQLIQ